MLHRSPALQQYDEARKNVTVGSNCSSSPSKARPATTQAKAATAELRQDDGWSLCGWQDEPSVVRSTTSSKQVTQQMLHATAYAWVHLSCIPPLGMRTVVMHALHLIVNFCALSASCSLLQHAQHLQSWCSTRQRCHPHSCPAHSSQVQPAATHAPAVAAAGRQQVLQAAATYANHRWAIPNTSRAKTYRKGDAVGFGVTTHMSTRTS